MGKFANNGDPDQTPHSSASDLDLHCLRNTLLGVSKLKWVNEVVRSDVFMPFRLD